MTQTRLFPRPEPPPKDIPPDWEDLWPVVDDEADRLSDQMDCYEEMLVALRRLRSLVQAAPMVEAERMELLLQMRHILKHLKEPLHTMQADRLLRGN